MKRQWHPVFVNVLGLLLEEYYKIEPEAPVSDLPRRGDVLILRRKDTASPPFVGLWSRLTEWNVVEFKGPTDEPEAKDLELLMHVGTGLTYRLNEERVAQEQEELASRHVSIWYLAPQLGKTFLGAAQSRTAFTYETGGLWRGWSWGHPLYLVAYQDTVVEVDTIPLRLLDRPAPAPLALGELVASRQDLLERFARWFVSLQPDLWKEIQRMTQAMPNIIDWERVSQVTDVRPIIKILPPTEVIQYLGVEQAIEAIGAEKVLATIGRGRVIELLGEDRLLAELLAKTPPERVQELLRQGKPQG